MAKFATYASHGVNFWVRCASGNVSKLLLIHWSNIGREGGPDSSSNSGPPLLHFSVHCGVGMNDISNSLLPARSVTVVAHHRLCDKVWRYEIKKPYHFVFILDLFYVNRLPHWCLFAYSSDGVSLPIQPFLSFPVSLFPSSPISFLSGQISILIFFSICITYSSPISVSFSSSWICLSLSFLLHPSLVLAIFPSPISVCPTSIFPLWFSSLFCLLLWLLCFQILRIVI